MNAFVIAATAGLLYLVIVIAGQRTGLWKRLRITLFGPVLMLRTQRGRRTIERLARAERLWTGYGRLAVWVTLAATASLTVFLVQHAGGVGSDDSTVLEEGAAFDKPAPPGSPLATIAYIVVGFATAIAIHELAHGIMAAVARIRLLSIGVLLLVIPVGAFVEPDDRDLKRSQRSSRERLYASGPASNIVVAGLFLMLLVGVFGPAAEPSARGALVVDIAADSPAGIYGIDSWSEIVSVEGAPVLNGTQMRQVSFAEPGELVTVGLVYKSALRSVEVPGGVVLHRIYEGPGHDAGLRPGMIVRSLNNTVINSVSEFRSVTENASRHEPVEITVMSYSARANGGLGGYVEDRTVGTVNLTSKWLYYQTHYPWANREEFRNMSFMAVTATPLGVWTEDPECLVKMVAKPFGSVGDLGELADALREYVGLPITGFSPVVSPAAELYEPGGLLHFMPSSVYWVTVNLLYWLFWANLMLGLANVLPSLPFDGGYLLREVLKGVAGWWEKRVPGLDRTIGRRIFTENSVDDIMLFVSGMVTFLVAYLLLAGAFRSALGA